MTTADWLVEYHALRAKEQLYIESSVKVLKNVLVSVLGLNAIRPDGPNGRPKSWDEMTVDEKDNFLPLIAWVGRSELLQRVQKQIDTDTTDKPGTFHMDEDKYEKLIEQIDQAGGDMEPILGLEPISTKKPERPINKDNVSVEDV